MVIVIYSFISSAQASSTPPSTTKLVISKPLLSSITIPFTSTSIFKFILPSTISILFLVLPFTISKVVFSPI